MAFTQLTCMKPPVWAATGAAHRMVAANPAPVILRAFVPLWLNFPRLASMSQK